MKKIQILDSFTLKIIALISMFIDHFAATVLTFFEMKAYGGYEENISKFANSLIKVIENNMVQFQNIVLFMRIIGRIAFPIYCFLLVQGFIYTKSKYKYAIRLLIFALISELPFDMAFNEIKNVEFQVYNNVFFTLFVGFMFIWSVDFICKKRCEALKKVKKIDYKTNKEINKKCIEKNIRINTLFIIALFIAAIIIYKVTIICASDYGVAGVVCVLLMYLLRKNNVLAFVMGTLSVYIITCNFLQIFAMLGIIPIAMYNGKKGRSMKWFFYIFYPAHLMIFVLISSWLGVFVL